MPFDNSDEILKNENSVNKIEIGNIEDYTFKYDAKIWIIDYYLSCIFEVSTKRLRTVILKHINLFSNEELYQFKEADLEWIKNNYDDLISSVPPFALSVKGVLKVASYIQNDKTNLIIDSFIKSCLEQEVFSVDNPLLQKLYDCLTDTYHYKKIKEKFGKQEKQIKELKEKVRNLEFKNQEMYIDKENMRTRFLFIICAIFVVVIGYFEYFRG